MTVDLDALANDLRAAAEGFVLRDPDDALVVHSRDGGRLLVVEESGRCVLGSDAYELTDVIVLAPVFAIIARHLGAGQPVAGTGETLYRKCPHCPGDGTSCWTCDDEGYVPVALPDDRTVNCHVCGGYIGVRFGEVYTPGDDICNDCVAMLSARFAVPVEGA